MKVRTGNSAAKIAVLIRTRSGELEWKSRMRYEYGFLVALRYASTRNFGLKSDDCRPKFAIAAVPLRRSRKIVR